MNKARSGLELAPPPRRLMAFLIDSIILAVINLGMLSIIGDAAIEDRSTLGLLLIVTATYNLAFLITRSATPGKAAMGMYVGDHEGRRLQPDKAILRYLGMFVWNLSVMHPLLFLVMTGVIIANVILMHTDSMRRTLHDRLAGTVVLAGRPPP